MVILSFWVVTPCRLVSRYEHIEEIYCPQAKDVDGMFLVTVVSTRESTRRYIPQEQNRYLI
jgi:hypothetical protein